MLLAFPSSKGDSVEVTPCGPFTLFIFLEGHGCAGDGAEVLSLGYSCSGAGTWIQGCSSRKRGLYTCVLSCGFSEPH